MSQVKLTKSKDTRPVKVYSFKAELSAEQLATVQVWLIALEEVWNAANAALDTKRLISSIRHRQSEPSPTATWEDTTADLLSKIRAKKWWPEDSIQQVVPTTLRDGLIDTLKKSWKKYYDDRKKGVMTGRPKMKGVKRPVSSLLTLNGAKEVKVVESGPNAYVTFPGLGSFKIKGYHKRFHGGLDYGKVALVQDGNDWFIQFSARHTPANSPTAQPRIVGVDPGIKAVVATSDGHVIQPRRKDAKLRQRMKRLQRKLARQQRGSKSSEATKAAIRGIHAKVRRRRKGFNAKLADWLGRFDIAFEGSRLRDMSRRAKPKPREDGKGWERNNAKAKSGLNRELLDNGLGQIRQLTEDRCKSRGKRFVKTAEADVRYSSRRCHCCGELGKRSTQEKFVCLNRGCRLHGIIQHADVNAAKNHAKAGYSIPSGIYPSAMGKVMGAESGATLAGQPGLQPTAATLEASKTTPLPSDGQSLQGSESVKDDATTPSGETFTSKAKRRTSAKNPTCKPPKLSTAKVIQSRNQAVPTAIPSTKRKSRRYLQSDPQDAHQLSLWGTHTAG
jgi:transposase